MLLPQQYQRHVPGSAGTGRDKFQGTRSSRADAGSCERPGILSRHRGPVRHQQHFRHPRLWHLRDLAKGAARERRLCRPRHATIPASQLGSVCRPPGTHDSGLWRLLPAPTDSHLCRAGRPIPDYSSGATQHSGTRRTTSWIGHLEIAHWLHGASWPAAYADRILSGSPAHLSAARCPCRQHRRPRRSEDPVAAFMLGATVLLYLTASRLIGRGGAAVAAAIWALSEPALRLAFATYDPLSVVLTALSAWLIVLGYRHGSAFVVAAAAALALANATAYSGIVIDPVVIAFAFLVWLPRMRARQAALRTALLSRMLRGVLRPADDCLAVLGRASCSRFSTGTSLTIRASCSCSTISGDIRG